MAEVDLYRKSKPVADEERERAAASLRAFREDLAKRAAEWEEKNRPPPVVDGDEVIGAEPDEEVREEPVDREALVRKAAGDYVEKKKPKQKPDDYPDDWKIPF